MFTFILIAGVAAEVIMTIIQLVEGEKMKNKKLGLSDEEAKWDTKTTIDNSERHAVTLYLN